MGALNLTRRGASGLTHTQTSPQTQGGACPAPAHPQMDQRHGAVCPWCLLGAPLGSRLSPQALQTATQSIQKQALCL